MITTGNMGLVVWDQIKDPFDFGQLENNWQAIDNHDHTSGRGVQIGTGGIQLQAVTQPLLGLSSVGNAQLQPGSVRTSTIQAGAITNPLIGVGAVNATSILDGSIGPAELDPNLIPLGTVTQWWRPPGSAAVPGGVWEIMDGRPWNSITNAWGLNSGNIPNMVNKFAMGEDLAHIGVTGGTASFSLAHSHGVNAHTHTVTGHSHTIDHDGTHAHNFYGGLGLWSRENAISPNIAQLRNANGGVVDVTYYSLYLKNLPSRAPFSSIGSFEGAIGSVGGSLDAPTPLDNAGDHNHGGNTGGNGWFETAATAPGTDTQLSTVNVTPPYVGLLFIMRVR